MTRAATIPRQTEPDARARALVASYERAGYVRVAPAIIQPAEPFLDLSGEDIRQRMFLTADPHGRELCLRPDFTIAVSRDYLASAEAGPGGGISAISARCSGRARTAPVNFCRRAWSRSDAQILPPPMPKCCHLVSKPRRNTA